MRGRCMGVNVRVRVLWFLLTACVRDPDATGVAGPGSSQPSVASRRPQITAHRRNSDTNTTIDAAAAGKCIRFHKNAHICIVYADASGTERTGSRIRALARTCACTRVRARFSAAPTHAQRPSTSTRYLVWSFFCSCRVCALVRVCKKKPVTCACAPSVLRVKRMRARISSVCS